MKHTAMLLVCGLTLLGCATTLETASSDAPSLVETCTDLARRLDMPVDSADLQETEEGYLYHDKGLTCRFDFDGRFTMISSAPLEVEVGSEEPVVLDKDGAIQIAESALAKIDFQLFEDVHTDKEHWNEGTKLVTVRSYPIAYGYSTNGFAGRRSVTINRLTGKVCSIAFGTARTPDEPNIQITEEEAIRTARLRWAESEMAGRERDVQAHLQYFPATGPRATPEGRAFEEQKRLRMCWVVTFLSGRAESESEASADLGTVAIDAETGKILEAG